ncbi:DUF1826 domain-containing protein [Qipengyuania sp. DGS5-3]|uniref:DUF1826 domain-containing protein n=1 Tax=Qipengyuania sp. DGS5-3 TaxID=3349632 RepID=UPI0036D2F416
MSTTLDSIAQISDQSTILRSIKDEACSIAIWERQPLGWTSGLITDGTRDIRLNTPLSDVRVNVAQALPSSGFGNHASHRHLVDDIVDLADLYCSTLGIEELEVRLEVVTTDSCRKWHADYVKARLITTYSGDGPQWLDAGDADRVKQGGEPQRINQLRTGDVGIFKGKLAAAHPAIHRSPPIAGTGQTRLLLVLNHTDKD